MCCVYKREKRIDTYILQIAPYITYTYSMYLSQSIDKYIFIPYYSS